MPSAIIALTPSLMGPPMMKKGGVDALARKGASEKRIALGHCCVSFVRRLANASTSTDVITVLTLSQSHLLGYHARLFDHLSPVRHL